MSVKSINNAYLKAARVLESTKACGPALQKWFEQFKQAKAIFDEHGTLDGFMTRGLTEWRKRSRRNWEEGNLANEQIAALQSINIQRTEKIERGHSIKSPRTGEKMQRTLDLMDSFNKKAPLTEEEITELNRNIAFYLRHYHSGRMSEATAKKLGFAIY